MTTLDTMTRAPPLPPVLSRVPSTIRTDKEQTMSNDTTDRADQTATDPQHALSPVH